MNSPNDLLKELRIDRSAPPPPPRSRWPLVVVLLVVALAGVGGFMMLRSDPLPVRTAVAEAGAAEAPGAASVLDATGYVTARRMATVSSKVTGKVLEVLIEEGQAVKAGDVLARLEPTDADAQRALSAAQLQAARSEIVRAQAELALADKTLARNRDLAARQLVSRQLLDQSQAERDALAAQLQSARSNVNVAEQALSLSDIGVDNTVVRAPFDGVVTVKAAQPGEIISPMSAGGGFTRTGIGTIVDMASLEIQVDVNESYIGRVKPGQEVEAVLNAYPDWKIPAEVIAIVPTADRSKATVKVRVAFLQRDPRIVPDMGVRVAFLDDAPAAAAPVATGVRVPADAVVEREGRNLVFVVSDDRAARREVEAAPPRDGFRRVTRGLAVGETVVRSPPAELVDGAKVVAGTD